MEFIENIHDEAAVTAMAQHMQMMEHLTYKAEELPTLKLGLPPRSAFHVQLDGNHNKPRIMFKVVHKVPGATFLENLQTTKERLGFLKDLYTMLCELHNSEEPRVQGSIDDPEEICRAADGKIYFLHWGWTESRG